MFKEPFPNYGDALKNSRSGKIDVTYSDYQHAISVYNDFGCQNLGDYHDDLTAQLKNSRKGKN